MFNVSVTTLMVLLVAGFLLAVGLEAQETAGAPVTGSYRADGLGLRKDVDALKQRITSVTTQLMEIKSCHEQGKIYAPQAGETVNKCIDFMVEAASATNAIPEIPLPQPPGLWTIFCRNINIVNNIMTTDCRRGRVGFAANTIDLRTCRSLGIPINGVLTCR